MRWVWGRGGAIEWMRLSWNLSASQNSWPNTPWDPALALFFLFSLLPPNVRLVWALSPGVTFSHRPNTSKEAFFFYVFHPNVVHHFSITICPNFCCVYPSHHFPCAFYHFKYLIKWWKQVDGRRKVKNWNFFNPINPPQRNNLIKETAK